MATQALVDSIIEEIIEPGVASMSWSNYSTPPSCAPADCRRKDCKVGLCSITCIIMRCSRASLSAWLKIVTTPNCSIFSLSDERRAVSPGLGEKIRPGDRPARSRFSHGDADLRVPGAHQQNHPRHAARLGAEKPRSELIAKHANSDHQQKPMPMHDQDWAMECCRSGVMMPLSVTQQVIY